MGELKNMARDSAPKPGILFDADDTLFPNTYMYDEAYKKMQALFSELGFDSGHALEKMKEIDLQSVHKFGFSAKRFPTSMVDTYGALCEEKGIRPDPEISQKFFSIGNEVFEGPWELYPGVKETLEELKSAGFVIVVLTAGDVEVQTKKVESLGLQKLFDGIEIVGMKTVASYHETIEKFSLDPNATTMVGNSLKSDIYPARVAGISAIHVPIETWAFENLKPEQKDELERLGYHTVQKFPQILGLLSPNGSSKVKN